MEQHPSPEPAHAYVPNPTPDLTAFQAQIDPYLDRICLPLARTLSADEAAEQRAEMRTHLEALYTGYLETGSSETEATRLSLDHFGRARRIQHDWQIECETTQFASKKSAGRSALRFALRSFGLAFLLPAVYFAAVNYVYDRLPTSFFASPLSIVVTDGLNIFVAALILFPFLAGICVGNRVRYRPVLVSIASTLLTCLLIPTLVTLTFHGVFPFIRPIFGNSRIGLACASWLLVAEPVLIVMPFVGMAGAVLGHLCRRFQQRWIASRG